MVSSTPRPHFTPPPEKTQYPLYRRLGGPRADLDRQKISPPLGFNPRTVQPVVSPILTELPGPQSGIRGGIISTVCRCLGNTIFHHTILTSSLFILKSVPKVPISHTIHSTILNKVSVRILIYKLLKWSS